MRPLWSLRPIASETFELLSTQAAALAVAEEQVRVAARRSSEFDGSGRTWKRPNGPLPPWPSGEQCRGGTSDCARTAEGRGSRLRVQTEAAKAAGADSSTTATVARQSLELRRVAAEQASRNAQQRIDEANAAQNSWRLRKPPTLSIGSSRPKPSALVGLLPWRLPVSRLPPSNCAGWSARAGSRIPCSRRGEITAQADVAKEASLRARLEAATRERDGIISRRTAIAVPHSLP